MNTIKHNGKEVPAIHAEVKVTIKNKKKTLLEITLNPQKSTFAIFVQKRLILKVISELSEHDWAQN